MGETLETKTYPKILLLFSEAAQEGQRGQELEPYTVGISSIINRDIPMRMKLTYMDDD